MYQQPPDQNFYDTELYCMSLSKFVIRQKIGGGSMGTIHLADYTPNGQTYALKIVEYKHWQTVMEGLAICEQFDHENVVKCYGHFSHCDDKNKFIVEIMEYVPGYDLHTIYTENTYEYVLNIFPRILPQIVQGLQYIHTSGYIHRDIKLENIMITSDGTAKIIDYDFIIHQGKARNAKRCGTPYYASPEMLDNTPVDHRTDLWSLGVLLYILLVGTYPFKGRNKDELFDNIMLIEPDFQDIPKIYRRIIGGLLEKDIRKRISLPQISKILKGI